LRGGGEAGDTAEGSAIREIKLREIERPLRTAFSTSLGRKHRLHNMRIEVELRGGGRGMGEVPTSAAFKGETIGRIGWVLREAARRLRGTDVNDWARSTGDLRRAFPEAPMTVSGLEVALFRACLSERGISEHAYWGGRLRRLATDITLPLVADPRALAPWMDFAARRGFTTYKVKVSGNLERDLETVSFIYRSLEERVPAFRLRLDGNQGYTTETFLDFCDCAEERGYGIELFEQPLEKHDFEGLAYIKKRSPVPIILDETVLTAADAERVIGHDLGHGINIKLAKSGISESERILQLARQHRLKLMIGCMIETMVGLSAAVFLAAGSGSFDFIDLDSVHFLYGKNAYPGIGREGPAFLVMP
jgi:L-alanine-DL-glutamate epimerase-like enolase superfamily enzyme